jgi:hypothetical protein
VIFDKYIRSELFAGIPSLSDWPTKISWFPIVSFYFLFFFLKAYVGRTHTE